MQLLVSNHAAGREAGAAMLELADVGVIDVAVFGETAAQTLTKLATEDVSGRYSRKFHYLPDTAAPLCVFISKVAIGHL